MPCETTDFLLLGHYCHDTLLLPNSLPVESLGGGVAYGGRALENAGAAYSVVSWVGQDFRYWHELPKKPDSIATVRTSKRAPTTAFIDDERDTTQRQTVTAVCKNIQLKDLPHTLPRTAVFTGLMGEIEPDVITALASKATLTLIDAQGLLRQRNPQTGALSLTPLKNTPYATALTALTVIKASKREAAHLPLETLRRHSTLVITDGPRGVTVLTSDNETNHATTAVTETDPTGAGDSFLAGLAWALHEKRNWPQAIEIAQGWGAAAVQFKGLPPRARP
jgi:1D-myo-inositol 3-kinase